MIKERIEEHFPGVVRDHHAFRGDHTVVVASEHLLALAEFLHAEGFQQLMDVTAVDWKDREPRFDVVYHFLNLLNQERLRVKVPLGVAESVPSLVGVFKSADWSEREVFDLFGIQFSNHPDLRRLLMWDDFQGHPLRKDFPMDGGDVYCNSDTETSYAGNARTLNP